MWDGGTMNGRTGPQDMHSCMPFGPVLIGEMAEPVQVEQAFLPVPRQSLIEFNCGGSIIEFNEWAKERFNEVRRTYPNLVWEPPQVTPQKITWANLHKNMQVICRQVSNGKRFREVYLDSARQTVWDWEE